MTPKMAAENPAAATAGIHGLAERVAYRYAAIERKHRFRFLFNPLRLLEQTGFIEAYLAGGNPFPRSVEIDPPTLAITTAASASTTRCMARTAASASAATVCSVSPKSCSHWGAAPSSSSAAASR